MGATHRTPAARAARLAIVAALVLGLVPGPLPVAHAATFTAHSTTDAPDANPGNGLCATAASECTLRAAIQETNALGGGPHTIVLLGGLTYTLTRTGDGEDSALTGDLDIKSNLAITVSGGSAVIRGASGWTHFRRPWLSNGGDDDRGEHP